VLQHRTLCIAWQSEENVLRPLALFFFEFFNRVMHIGDEIRVGHSCILFYRYFVHLRVADVLKPENAAFGLRFKRLPARFEKRIFRRGKFEMRAFSFEKCGHFLHKTRRHRRSEDTQTATRMTHAAAPSGPRTPEEVSRASKLSWTRKAGAEDLWVHVVAGDTWSGSLCPSDGPCPTGHGVYHFQNTGLRVSGSIDRGLLQGPGRLTWEDGSRYEGEFSRSTLHGNGEYVWPSGDVYRGEWRDGKRNGTGTYVSSGNSHSSLVRQDALKALGLPSARCMRYCGEWEGDVMVGRGVQELFSTPDASGSGLLRKFDGLFANGYPVSGSLQTHGESGVEAFESVCYDGATSIGEFPTWYWAAGDSTGGTNLVVLPPTGEEFASVSSRFHESMLALAGGPKIHCIQRVENHEMRALYDLQRRVLEKKVTAPPRSMTWDCKRLEGWAFHAPVRFSFAQVAMHTWTFSVK